MVGFQNDGMDQIYRILAVKSTGNSQFVWKLKKETSFAVDQRDSLISSNFYFFAFRTASFEVRTSKERLCRTSKIREKKLRESLAQKPGNSSGMSWQFLTWGFEIEILSTSHVAAGKAFRLEVSKFDL